MINMSEYDTEPTYPGGDMDKVDLIRLLNWYAAYSNEDEKKTWVIDWARQNAPERVPAIEATNSCMFFTNGSLARLAMRGFPLQEAHVQKLKDFVNKL